MGRAELVRRVSSEIRRIRNDLAKVEDNRLVPIA